MSERRRILEKNFGNNRAQDDFNIVSEPWITYRAFSWSDHRQRERIPVSHFSQALLTQGTECNVENSQKKVTLYLAMKKHKIFTEITTKKSTFCQKFAAFAIMMIMMIVVNIMTSGW